MLDIEGAFKKYMESMEWHNPPETMYPQEDVKALVEGNLRGFCIMLALEMKKEPLSIVTTVETNKPMQEVFPTGLENVNQL